MMKYIEPVAARNMTDTHKIMLKTLIAKEKLRFGGFFTTSQIRLGSQKVVGANPIAPKKPMRSPKKGRETATKHVNTTYRLRMRSRVTSLLRVRPQFLKDASIISNTGILYIW